MIIKYLTQKDLNNIAMVSRQLNNKLTIRKPQFTDLPLDKIPVITKFLTGHEKDELRSVNESLRSVIRPNIDKTDYVIFNKLDIPELILNMILNKNFEKFFGVADVDVINIPPTSSNSVDNLKKYLKKYYQNISNEEKHNLCLKLARYLQQKTKYKIFVVGPNLFIHYLDLLDILTYIVPNFLENFLDALNEETKHKKINVRQAGPVQIQFLNKKEKQEILDLIKESFLACVIKL